MPVEEVLEKEPQQGSAESQPQAVNGVKRGRGRPRTQGNTRQTALRDEERTVNSGCVAGVGEPEQASQTAQGAALCAKKKHDKEVCGIPQGRPRQNNQPYNAPGPSQSGSTAADSSKDTEETDSHPDYVHADVDANPESGSFTAREDEAL
eukprot:2093256-Rhodomonas_salina.1